MQSCFLLPLLTAKPPAGQALSGYEDTALTDGLAVWCVDSPKDILHCAEGWEPPP